VNPVGALRTGALLALQGTTAFGAASLAFLRFTKGTTGAFLLLSGSLILWTVIPFALAARRLSKTDV
jgi:Cu-processing system permease protein